MSEQAKAELVRNIDTRTKSFNRELEDAQAEWQQDQDRVLQDLGQKMMAVIDKYAKDNGFSLILDVSNPQTPVLYASNTIDVTKDIVDLYDKNAASLAPAAVDEADAHPRHVELLHRIFREAEEFLNAGVIERMRLSPGIVH